MKKFCWFGMGLILLSPSSGLATISNVSTADQVCPPSADPCVINQTIELVDGALLDFGTRTVRVDSGGVIDTGAGSAAIRCGEFIVTSGNTLALLVRGSNGAGGIDGGVLSILARRRCSLDSTRLCANDAQCRPGSCTLRLCTLSSSRRCLAAGDCQVGPCGADGFCSGDPRILCSADTDCAFGDCAPPVCSADPAISCTTNADCDLGTCSVGTGTIDLNGVTRASGLSPGDVDLSAAGDITVRQLVNASSTAIDGDGGSISIDSGRGSITIDGQLSVTGGGQGGGGELFLFAAGDLVINQSVDAGGGDFDGGIIDLTAGGDIRLLDSALANSNSGAGFGGDVSLLAGRDLLLGAAAEIAASGHTSAIDSFGGDGGAIDLQAGRDVLLMPGSRIRANGALPDGFGGDLSIDALRDVTLDGQIQLNAQGNQGSAGMLSVFAAGGVSAAASSSIDCTGGSTGGCEVDLDAGGSMALAGSIDTSTGGGGAAGNTALRASGDLSLGGNLISRGGGTALAPSLVLAEGCNLTVPAGSAVTNDADFGRTDLVSHRMLTVEASATVRAGGMQGSNNLIYGNPALPPIVAGTVAPAPQILLDQTLTPCSVCGNGQLEPGETCDDGNTDGGDGCSADCQDEGCIAATPGYPSVPLCEDADGCTTDSCDPALHDCVHLSTCDDGIDCTIDSCLGAACVHVPDDAACEDGDSCSLDSCSPVTGCVSAPREGPCDDGIFCNGADQCLGGVCSVHSGDPCAGGPECADQCDELRRHCLVPALQPCSDDGNPCTSDVCSGNGTCVHSERTGPCDDGDFCNGPDICQSGQCSLHLGDPCVVGGECQNVCNAVLGICANPQGAACGSDGNPCTDDVCDGAGACDHVPNTASCDDGDFCTVLDRCAAGACVAADRLALSKPRLRLLIRSGPEDRMLIKAEAPLDAVTVTPEQSGFLLVVRADDGTILYQAFLPSTAWTDVRARGKVFRFKDRRGEIVEASGTRSATLKRVNSRQVFRLKLRAKDVELDALGAHNLLSLSLLLGDVPGSGPCLSAQAIPCRVRGVKILCE